MQGVIQGIGSQVGRTCMLSAIATIVQYLKPRVEVSEAVLLGLGAGFSFRYGYYENEEAAYPIATEFPDIACFHIDLDGKGLGDLLARYGVDFVEQRHSSLGKMTQAVGSDVSRGRPVLVIVNDRYLDYLPQELRRDEARFVVCHGWDSQAGKAWVTDRMIPSQPPSRYQGPTAIARLEQALDLRDVVHDDTYVTWHFGPGGAPLALTPEDIAQGAARSWQAMLEGGIETYHFGSSRVVYRCGNHGMQALAHNLLAKAGTEIGEDVRLWLLELYALLTLHAGPVIARTLFGDYLLWAQRQGLLSGGEALAQRCRALGESWATIGKTLGKAAISGDPACVERGVERIRKIADTEAQLVGELRDRLTTGVGP